ncbi:hypothetical protein DFP72DRAFT_1176579 [Ephemerocybe angulata]|uniref:Uncharacterized protein n=1 Tax=Ephemerocybe angulata TaxID=980116 RepID=A0A8H6LXP6_9AGAR|nr:hypothetical protein DFP72DRAFT_1176579 [Tulosesus angulatus]
MDKATKAITAPAGTATATAAAVTAPTSTPGSSAGGDQRSPNVQPDQGARCSAHMLNILATVASWDVSDTTDSTYSLEIE